MRTHARNFSLNLMSLNTGKNGALVLTAGVSGYQNIKIAPKRPVHLSTVQQQK